MEGLLNRKFLLTIFAAAYISLLTFDAGASTRIMNAGQAAGTTAAIAVLQGILPYGVDRNCFRKQLIESGEEF